MEIIFWLLFLGLIVKLLEWMFSPLLDKVGHAVYTIRQMDAEQQQKTKLQTEVFNLKRQVFQMKLKQLENEEILKNTEEASKRQQVKDESSKIDKDIFKKEKSESYNQQETSPQSEEVDPLKAKGDRYELYIGQQFEKTGSLVIYNGFIMGYEDGGVDIATISANAEEINLIQCKHWSLKTLELEHIETIYEKLNTHRLDFLHFNASQINEYLSNKKKPTDIMTLLLKAQKNINNFTIRKTLYISSDKVVDLEIGQHLTMMKPNIFRYKDMKIVVEQY